MALYPDPARIVASAHTYRVSSWDRTGRNQDYLIMRPGDTATLLDEPGPGRIAHFYWTTVLASRLHYRQLVLRAWWDVEDTPSIEAPLGDLFLIPHCTPVPVRSLGATVNLGTENLLSWGANLYLPMPFARSARITLSYEPIPDHPSDPLPFWYHLDMERYDEPLPADVGYLHAQWRRENPTTSISDSERNVSLWDGANLDGRENYVALAAEGRGQMVGLHLQVDNIAGGWWGEGDDMVYVDGRPGEQWPPTYHGTGSEEIFGGGACPNRPYAGPYTGFHLVESRDFAGRNAMYRWYLADPIRFQKSLVWSIEHGHANNFENDYSSVAYWYQEEPHAPFPKLPAARERLPRFPEAAFRADAARVACKRAVDEYRQGQPDPDVLRRANEALNQGAVALAEGRWDEALAHFEAGSAALAGL